MPELVPYTDKLAARWRQALENAVITPGPAGGPEYVTTVGEPGVGWVLLDYAPALVPLTHRRIKHFGMLAADLYEGIQTNSILGDQLSASALRELLAALPPKCNILLQLPEELLVELGSSFEESGFQPRQRFTYHVVDFTESYNEWFNRRTVRRILIRKARKQGVEVKFGGRELLADFYDLYLKSFRRWVRQGKANWHHRLSRFERMFDLPDSGVLIGLAALDGQVIACTMVCMYERTAAGLYGGIDYAFRNVKASNLLYAELFRLLIKRGVRRYNMGTSNELKGVIDFKESLGGEPRHSIVFERHRFPLLRRLLGRGSSQITDFGGGGE